MVPQKVKFCDCLRTVALFSYHTEYRTAGMLAKGDKSIDSKGLFLAGVLEGVKLGDGTAQGLVEEW